MTISYQTAVIRRERIMRAVEELGLLHDVYRLDDECAELTATAQDAIILCGRQLEILTPMIEGMDYIRDRDFAKVQAERMLAATPVTSLEKYEEMLAAEDAK